ncbi:MAG: hypothetical protein V9E88_15190 [Ferruginibacter sp.]
MNLNVTSANAGYTYVWNPGSLSGAAQTVTPLGTTAYIVTATDASAGPFNGCVNQATVNVTSKSSSNPVGCESFSSQCLRFTDYHNDYRNRWFAQQSVYIY